ncbi:MAG: glycoside hydrolase family 28 protein [Melioribacteraceae bacterium]
MIGKTVKAFILAMIFFTSLSRGENNPFYNIADFGAIADGKTKNTEVFKMVIAKVKEAGGGTVYVPPGVYLTGPIHFIDNMTLYVEAGATIKFSTDFDDYLPLVPRRFQGLVFKGFSPLLYAYEVNNIAIKGRGKIDGQGFAWQNYYKEFREIYKASNSTNRNIDKWQADIWEANKPLQVHHGGFLRPQLLHFYKCTDVLLEEIRLRDTPFWTCHFALCENVNVRGVDVKNPPGMNPDGITIESCKNVHISDCHLDVDDDGFTIKAGRDSTGRWEGNSAENITITNCTVIAGAAGFAIGSEMSGDVRNVTVSNSVYVGTGTGVYIKTVRGRGGVVENITVDNLIVKNTNNPHSGVAPAIGIDMHYYKKTEQQPVTENTPKFRNLHFSNISGDGNEQTILVNGLVEMPIENISFSNINLGGGNGIICKNVNGIRLNNVTVTPDTGVVFASLNVSDLEINGLSTRKNMKNTPLIKLRNTSNAFIHSTFLPQGIKIFMELSGKNNDKIYLGTEDESRFSDDIVFKNGATKESLIR